MVTLLVAIVLIGMISTALCRCGIFHSSYTDACRIGFYLILLLGLVAVVLTIGRHPIEGYGHTPATP